MYIWIKEDKLIFGKYQGYDISYIIEKDPNYIIWCINTVKDFKNQLKINYKIKISKLSCG